MTPLFLADKKHSLKVSVYNDWIRRDLLQKKNESEELLSKRYGLSVSTVKRYVNEVAINGLVPRKKESTQGRQIYAWSSEALAFLKAFYLAALHEVGSCTYRNAYRRTVEKAQAEGWQCGSEQSAYVHLRSINAALIAYAKGGRRELDNMFWILRDLSRLRPFQVIVGDQHRFDFWVQDEESGSYFRPECYIWLDMRTRLVYGLAFDRHYTTSTVLRALRVGLELFGRFECTYNDNGSSESSAWSSLVVEQLQQYGMRWDDTSELYRDSEGRYIVEDDDGNVVQFCSSREEWKKENRRIFARVKNAKTKPIERFFSTLEQILLDMCLPGFVRELGMSAPEQEKAEQRIARQRKLGQVLTYRQFAQQVAIAVDTYNNRTHSSLGCSPLQELENARERGFNHVYLNPDDITYLFFDRAFARVQGDRVKLDKQWYTGPDLDADMLLKNAGSLVGLNRRKIEIRYNPDNPAEGVFAIDPRNNTAIPLKPIEAIGMLDQAAASEKLEWKGRQIKSVVSAFADMTKIVLKDSVVSIPAKTKSIEQNATQQRLSEKISSEPELKAHRKKVFTCEFDRYEYIIKRQCAGEKISKSDAEFRQQYESKMTDKDLDYWAHFIVFNTPQNTTGNNCQRKN